MNVFEMVYDFFSGIFMFLHTDDWMIKYKNENV